MSKIITNNITPRSGGSVGLTGGLNVTGNVSVGGTITYEDVTNVDSVGVITARSGIVVTGVVTATSFAGDGSSLTGVESWNQFDTWLYGGG